MELEEVIHTPFEETEDDVVVEVDCPGMRDILLKLGVPLDRIILKN